MLSDRSASFGEKCPTRAIAFSLISMIFPLSSSALDWQQKGHLKYNYSRTWYDGDTFGAMLQGRSPTLQLINARYDGEGTSGPWRMQIHYALSAAKAQADFFHTDVSNPDLVQVLSLSRWLVHDKRTQAYHRLDRFNLGYTADKWTLRAGRQAVSWGNGMNFQPLDIFNPFRPNAIDKDYKNGDDILYGQWLFEDGADVQFIHVPRRNAINREIAAAQSSTALKYRRTTALGDLNFLTARHYEDSLVGLGWSRSVGGAVARADMTYTRLHDQSNALAAVANADYSWNWFGFNYYGYVEYYYQSLGAKPPYNDIAVPLSQRINRGELFFIGEHYLDAGMMIELSARVHLTPAVVVNIADGSLLTPVSISFDFKQNVLFLAGFTWNHGQRGSEFGGIPAPPPYASLVRSPGQAAYALAAWYF